MSSAIQSVWRKTAQIPAFEPLFSDFKTDVLIIGSSLAEVMKDGKLIDNPATGDLKER